MCLTGLTAIVGSGYRLQQSRHDPTPAGRYLCGAVGMVGVSAIVSAPITIEATKAVEPFANATRLSAHVVAMIAAWCVQGMLVHLVTPTESGRVMRRQTLILAVAAAAMSALLATAPIYSTSNFVAVFADEPEVLGYLLVFCTYIGAASASYMRLTRRWARMTDRPWLRAGLTVVQLGAACGVCWAIGKALAAVAVFAGHPTGIESALSAALSAACVALIAIGATMPTWGPVITRPLRVARSARALRDLRPLWGALRTMPEIARTMDASRLPTGDAAERLTRCVVEIRDGLLLLTPYRDAGIRAAAYRTAQETGLDDRDCVAAAEAAAIAAALSANATPAASVPPLMDQDDSGGFDAEVAWLRRVSRAYQRLDSRTATEGDAVPSTRELPDHTT